MTNFCLGWFLRLMRSFWTSKCHFAPDCFFEFVSSRRLFLTSRSRLVNFHPISLVQIITFKPDIIDELHFNYLQEPKES
jgi:hypothetical protein